MASLLVVLLLAIFLPPLIHLGRYRRSIIESMSAALGRPVYVGGMQLRLLPTPGIAMTDFTVGEDPAFGYEPALHASSVVASLRLSSLWRGRLEVSSISLDEASLNLVRNSAGQWNIGSILLRASQIPNAPTGQRHPGANLRFPYIEASDARIDFKQGVEKKPFSLMNAEFSMWQASGGEWRLRLEAQPVRTDLELHLSDTGELHVEGSLRRAADLSAMPVDLRAEWSGAQLGQVSRLLTGSDSGWRGDLNATTTVRGRAGDLRLRSQVKIGNLRRQEFQPATTVDVDATCQSEYRQEAHMLGDITCFWPISAGHLLLTGAVQGFAAPDADLRLEINEIPASFPLTILGLMRPHAQTVTATGTINGSFELMTGPHRSLSGEATTSAGSVSWPGGSLDLPALHFSAAAPVYLPRAKLPRAKAHAEVPQEEAVQLQTLAIPFGEPEPLDLDARFTESGFELHAAGEASIDRLIAEGSNFGLLENSLDAVAPRGRADLNLTIKGRWIPPLSGGRTGIGSTGSMHLQNAELRLGFLRAPVEVTGADVSLGPEEISWQNAALRYRGIAMRGSLQFPALCNQAAPCTANFTLEAPTLSAAAMETALAGQKQGFLGQFLENALGRGGLSPWPPLKGRLQCGMFDLGRLALGHAVASISVEGNEFSIDSLDATALGGTMHANGRMSMENGIPQWKLDVRLTGAKAGDAAAIFRERWGGGTVTGEARLSMSGYTTPDLLSSASGDFRFLWQNGGFQAPGGAKEAPLEHFQRWTASGVLGNKTLRIAGGGLLRGNRMMPVRGTISLSRQLDLTLQTRSGDLKMGGTLSRPVFVGVVPH